MKRVFLLVFAAFHLFSAGARGEGTSVGSFLFKTQPLFDFRIAFYKSWGFSAGGVDGAVEEWLITNKPLVGSEDRASSIKIRFLDKFPARNDEELRAEIAKRHPGVVFSPSQDPEFTIGFRSEQGKVSEGRYLSYEYFLAEKARVIRLEVVRDKTENGAAQVDTILSNIRRPSGAPRVTGVSLLGAQTGLAKIGEEICYKIEVDLLRSDFDDKSLIAFEVQGMPEYHSFKRISWNRADSALVSCLKVNERFGPDGLRIEKLNVVSPSGGTVGCGTSGSNVAALNCCSTSGCREISYATRKVDNPKPVTRAPDFKAAGLTRSSRTLNRIHVEIVSALPLQIAQVTIGARGGMNGEAISQVYYGDQLSGTAMDLSFDSDRLPKGLTRVESVMLMDKVGNIGRLRLNSDPSKNTYVYECSDRQPAETEIRYFSIGE